jgi:putative ABC transport system permease protein
MNYWLRDFASRIDIAWWVFAFAGFSAITIAILTVIFQATKAALSNPLESLKTE